MDKLKQKIIKKITLLTVVLAGLAFASCKKEYTCECTVTTAGVSVTASSTKKDTKKNAKESCEAGSSSTTVGGVTSTAVCKIK